MLPLVSLAYDLVLRRRIRIVAGYLASVDSYMNLQVRIKAKSRKYECI
jgi:small nuclear ribonucleoprotein (snRNP)-like protein